MGTRWVRCVVVALAVTVATACSGSPTPKAEPDPSSAPPSRELAAPAGGSAAATPGQPTVIVIDASGSMAVEDAPGQRLQAAKDAVSQVLGSLPAGQEVGLVIYGSATGNSPAEQAAGCQDVVVALPVIPVKARLIVDALDPLQPSGYTPIGTSLQVAAGELPDAGPRSIVVVSDGVDSCAPDGLGADPCTVAADLHATDPDLTIDTLAFRSEGDPAAEEQLSCIATQGGGEYRAAADATSLAAQLSTALD